MTSKQKNLTFIILILAAVLFYVFSGGSVGISLDFAEEELTVSAANFDWVLSYAQIEALELTELPDLGNLIEGSEKRTLCCGIWENGMWGRYTLCVDPGISRCIVITMGDGSVFVLNYENGESTGQLHEMFTDLLHSKGYQ